MTSPLTPETLVYGLRPAADPQVSPDGTRLAYTVSTTEREPGKTLSQVWLANIDGTGARELTTAPGRNRSARWSPDGRTLAFLSDRSGDDALYLLPMDGGEARKLFAFHTAMADVAWSPDGRQLVFTAEIDPEHLAGRPDGKATYVRVTSRLDYKQDNRGYLGDTRRQVFVASAETGEHRQVTDDAVDHNFPQWNPDGSWLAMQVPNRNGMCSQLRLLRLSDGEAVDIGPEMGVVATWAWAPDGARIVFAGDTEQTWQTDIFLL
ncbi:MAG: PD40 domain-containing protein, partial [Dehalococcoidia bacterium]|nr:PD40 domain-containing protein [Dehalococcoidia bacterium]